MKIAILGAGAIGCYYGSRLLEAGNDVYFLMRSDRAYVAEHGLKIKSILGDMRIENLKLPASPAEIGPVDLVLVTWKTTSNENFKDSLPPLLGPDTIVLTLENGMGNAEALSQVVSKDKIFCGVCFISAFRTAPGEYKHMANGAISMTPAFSDPELLPQTEKLAAIFRKAKIPAKVYPNAECVMWSKVIWNVPFNGLSIINDGADVLGILNAPGGEDHVRRIMEDVVNAARARGHELREDIIEKQIEVTYAMGHYRPSSGIDFMNGRPVEFESIWKIPFELAKEAGAVMPEWEKLNEALSAKLVSRDKK